MTTTPMVSWCPFSRNTQAGWVAVAGVDILFSYETPVAFAHDKGGLRRDNIWGPTTGRHMTEAQVKHYRAASEEEFNCELNRVISEAVLNRYARKLEP